jgi:hypothetical protein
MRYLIPALALVALSACEKPEDLLENSIRTELAKRGEVKEVEMKQDGDERLAGFALVRADGREQRMNCAATKKNSTEYDWECKPAIDEAVLKGMEDSLRQQFEAQQITVVEIDMQKDGEDRMKGFAQLRDQAGEEARLVCTAQRQDTTFQGECSLPQGETDPAA